MGNHLFNLIINDLKLFFRSKTVVLLIIILPVLLSFISSFTSSMDIYPNLRIAFINEDKTFLGLFFMQYATSMLKGDNVIELSDRSELPGVAGNLDGTFIIPKGFSNNLLFQKPSELIFVPNPKSLQTTIAIYQVLSNVLREFKALPVIADPEFMKSVTVDPNYIAPRIVVEGMDESKLNFPAFIFPTVLGITLMLLSTIGVTWSMHEDRKNGLLEVFRLSNVSSSTFVLSKVFSYLVVAVIELLVFMIAGKFLGLEVASNYYLYFLVLMTMVFLFVSMGTLVATIGRSARGTQFLATGLSILLIILSGTLIPISMFPIWLKKLSGLLPSTGILETLQGISLMEYTWSETWLVLMINLLSAMAMILLSILFLKPESDSVITE